MLASSRICKRASFAAHRTISVLSRKMSTNEDFSSRRRTKSSEPSGSGSSPTWDHVFSEIKETPPQVQPGVGPRRPRRQTMTAHEISAFNDIFNMIFDALGQKESRHSPSADIGGPGMGELFSSLRRHSKKMKWTAQSDAELDRKKDEMDRCDTDQQLLNWAMREVFDESRLYLEEYKKATVEAMDSAKSEKVELPMLQPPTYPHLIALLVRAFRDKYHDPHLALSMFDCARRLSTPSYVFGCSTSAYNELLTTQWTCFRDLKGVHDALEEMSVNGVDMDSKTRELAEKVRREVGERNLWMEDNEMGTGTKGQVVWELLNNIERLVHQPGASRKFKQDKPVSWNDWRGEELANTITPDWEFGKF